MVEDLRKPTDAEKAELWKILTPALTTQEIHRQKVRQIEKVRAQIEFSTQQTDKIRVLLFGFGFAAAILVLFGIGLARRGFKKWAVIQKLQDAVLLAEAEEAKAKRPAQGTAESTPEARE